MNAREALQMIEHQVQDDYDLAPELRKAITALSAVLDERAALRDACQAIIREGNPDTATQDWPDPALFADWAIEQARAAITKAKGATEDATP